MGSKIFFTLLVTPIPSVLKFNSFELLSTMVNQHQKFREKKKVHLVSFQMTICLIKIDLFRFLGNFLFWVSDPYSHKDSEQPPWSPNFMKQRKSPIFPRIVRTEVSRKWKEDGNGLFVFAIGKPPANLLECISSCESSKWSLLRF